MCAVTSQTPANHSVSKPLSRIDRTREVVASYSALKASGASSEAR